MSARGRSRCIVSDCIRSAAHHWILQFNRGYMEPGKHFFFSGIGGSGMSPLAQLLQQSGNRVSGSDRSFDRRLNKSFFNKLRRQGIVLLPQNGSSIPRGTDCLVVSTAIEHDSPELQRARSLHIPVMHRSALLARLFNASRGIGIAGTSGKSTVTGMVASILDAAGKSPSVINGGIIKQYETGSCIGNARAGTSDVMVAEIDESDGSITRFEPKAGIITNITRDHKELDELRPLFQTFASSCTEMLVINQDCPESRSIRSRARVTAFGLHGDCPVTADQIDIRPQEIRFRVQGNPFVMYVPGLHNLQNALASIAIGLSLGLPMTAIQKGLASFRGIKRRLDIIGERNGILVVDDFAHNPDKISASVAALRQMGKRLTVVFQPHGYGPTRFMLAELARAFSTSLRASDRFLCLDIYDAGGTADRTITAHDLLGLVRIPHRLHVPGRKEAAAFIAETARKGDVVAVMGARDDSLSSFARSILKTIS